MILINELGSSLKPAGDYPLTLSHGPGVFEEARDYYRDHEGDRNRSLLVLNSEGGPFYELSWVSNNAGINGGRQKNMVHVEDFWQYDVLDKTLDFELIRRGEVFIFDTLEEYSYQLARIIRSRFPDRFIFFLDPKASWFFEESDCLHVVSSLNEFYNNYSYFLSKSIYHVSSRREFTFDGGMYLHKRYCTLQMMEGLYWTTKRLTGGVLHRDKVFCLIKNAVGSEGLVGMVRYVLYRASMASKKNGYIIPAVELAEKGDNNQFSHGSGENVWTMFFEQLTDIPLEEIHNSQNVILLTEQQFMFNPYLLEEFYCGDWKEMFRKFLRYNETTQNYIDELTKKVIPEEAGRILGVIGRGTDYRSSKIGGALGNPLDGYEMLDKVRELMTQNQYDWVFLATEDQAVFDVFMGSDIADKVLYVPQPRVDYSSSENNDKILLEIYAQENRDGYQDTLRYLGILDILAKRCCALIASVDCGSYYYAIALNDGRYEYTKAFAETSVGFNS